MNQWKNNCPDCNKINTPPNTNIINTNIINTRNNNRIQLTVDNYSRKFILSILICLIVLLIIIGFILIFCTIFGFIKRPVNNSTFLYEF